MIFVARARYTRPPAWPLGRGLNYRGFERWPRFGWDGNREHFGDAIRALLDIENKHAMHHKHDVRQVA